MQLKSPKNFFVIMFIFVWFLFVVSHKIVADLMQFIKLNVIAVCQPLERLIIFGLAWLGMSLIFFFPNEKPDFLTEMPILL